MLSHIHRIIDDLIPSSSSPFFQFGRKLGARNINAQVLLRILNLLLASCNNKMDLVSVPSLCKSSSAFFIFYLALFQYSTVEARLLSLSKPHHNSIVAYARWLASENSWGVLNTISSELGGAPFGNVVSYSDGLPGEGTGIPYFYLSTLDPTPANALKDPRASFSISEYPLGTCGKRDPENPTCAKMTLTGKLELLENDTEEAKFARNALYMKHHEMKVWPKDHNFRIFKLTTEDIFLINWFGGRKPITVDEYLNFKMKSGTSSIM